MTLQKKTTAADGSGYRRPIDDPLQEQTSTQISGERQHTFASLKVRNYRLYYSGQAVSNIGTWMQRIAQDWLVLELTNSPFAVGVTTVMQFAPTMVLGLWGGVLADRYPKRTLLMWSQAAMGVMAGIIAVLTLTQNISVAAIYATALGTGFATVFNNPARQAFVNELVGPSLLANAIALNSALFQAARLLGPALAGLLITAVGSGWAFAFNAVSYIPSVGVLLLMRRSELYPSKAIPRRAGQQIEGLRYVAKTPALRWPIVLALFTGIFGTNLAVMLTAYTKNVFHSGAGVYGLLNSAVAVGAVVGAVAAAGRRAPRMRALFVACGLFGLVNIAAGLTPWLWAFMAVLIVLGFCSTTLMTMTNTSVQLAADPQFRGRVLSLFGLVLLGSTPVGSVMLGAITEVWGPAAAMISAGSVLVAAAVVLAWLVSRESGLRLQVDMHRAATHVRIVDSGH
ncbi:MFS transporter [Nakamurella antarctica]|uniref:MFS transporter n=1 Tax=Nakamurella antarctica TaxID=1902245 RepID=A0A3G8ZJV3_9ACTN|nr:MFS transporter [Nakamurella antarctica]AZI57632.1 MFS transporter [Nakamurella antarctica]